MKPLFYFINFYDMVEIILVANYPSELAKPSLSNVSRQGPSKLNKKCDL